ncbi:Tom37 C-terminal domain-containing protein [Coniochaeta sp. 2T2.1]|nr:Tom37 C-terminal domain-containing protein [Coniochaeta sp. 2T2.1]
MVLELHVWGPAFGLPSLDPECLATIAFFTQALDRSEWTIVRSSPSAVPTRRLPTLHNPLTSTWTSSLPSIISHLHLHPPSTFHSPDLPLSPSALAKSTAYVSHLSTSAAPLLSLSLYASTANWTSATRPAYSAALPFPLGWTEVSAVRRSWLALADATGVDLLDAEDADRPTQAKEEGEEMGLPKDVKLPPKRKGVRDLLTPEQKARIRLQNLVRQTMAVLQDLKGGKKWFLTTEEGGGPTTLDCVAFGYLALMICPDLPRPWLRDAIVKDYPGLQAFVGDMTALCFGDGLPTATEARKEDGALAVTRRFVDGVVRNIPGLGEEWRRVRDLGLRWGDVLALAGGSVVAAVLLGMYVLHKKGLVFMPILGAPVHRWEAPRRGLAGFGAAGALFGGLLAPEVRFGSPAGGVGPGQSGSVKTEMQAPFGGKADGVEVEVDVDVE